MNDLTHEYKSWISELKTRYKQAQIKASVAVNGELLKFYFDLGKDISEKQFANTYGSAFYKTLSSDLITKFPDAKGFSPTNLKYAFYYYDPLQRRSSKSSTTCGRFVQNPLGTSCTDNRKMQE